MAIVASCLWQREDWSCVCLQVTAVLSSCNHLTSRGPLLLFAADIRFLTRTIECSAVTRGSGPFYRSPDLGRVSHISGIFTRPALKLTICGVMSLLSLWCLMRISGVGSRLLLSFSPLNLIKWGSDTRGLMQKRGFSNTDLWFWLAKTTQHVIWSRSTTKPKHWV